jgi:hypothetical protein
MYFSKLTDPQLLMTTASARHAIPEPNNRPDNILDAWISLEVLSPATFRYPEDLASNRDQRCIVSLDRPHLPWEGQGEKSRPNFQLFYHVVLGSIDLDQATKALLQKYSDSRAEMPKPRGRAVIATITLVRKGKPVGPPAVSLSSFAWGIPVALQKDFASLAQWPSVERQLVDSFDEIVRKLDENGEPLPLKREVIDAAYSSIISALHLPDTLVEPPFFIVRAYQFYKSLEPPEILLNSFFLHDLATAKQLSKDGNAPSNLTKYLGAPTTAQSIRSIERSCRSRRRSRAPRNPSRSMAQPRPTSACSVAADRRQSFSGDTKRRRHCCGKWPSWNG